MKKTKTLNQNPDTTKTKNFKPSQPKILTVIGNVGSGKSTIMPSVASVLNAHRVDADDLFQTCDPFRERYLLNLKRWSLANELWLTIERADMLKRELTKARKNHKKWVVVDSGLIMSWVYTYSHLLVGEIDRDEWELYEKIFDEVVGDMMADVVVYLDFPIKVLMQRIKKRGRDYELEFYKKQYLDQLEKSMEAFLEKSKGKFELVQLNEKDLTETADRKVLGQMTNDLMIKRFFGK